MADSIVEGSNYEKVEDKLVRDVIWPGLAKEMKANRKYEKQTFFLPNRVEAISGTIRTTLFDNPSDGLKFISERREKSSELESPYRDLRKPSIGIDTELVVQPKYETRSRRKPSTSPDKPENKDDEKVSPTESNIKKKVFVDESWKDGNKVFLKRHSSVGPAFQVAQIPLAGSYRDTENLPSSTYCELVWDPKTAEMNGPTLEQGEDVISKLPFNIKEEALLELARLGYDTSKLESVVNSIEPTDGSNWSTSMKDRYNAEIFKLRKNLKDLSKALNISFSSCMTYYLGTFKSSKYYRIVKTVCVEERLRKAETAEYVVDTCVVCGDGGNLLICDECEGEFHMTCLKPPLASVPLGRWECDNCVDRKIVEARDSMIRSSPLFEQLTPKKRSHEESTQGSRMYSTERKIKIRPKQSVLESVQCFARGIKIGMTKV